MSEEMSFKGFDGRVLLVRKWESTKKYNKKVIILLHRGHEHSKRLDMIAKNELFGAFKKYSYDYRGIITPLYKYIML